MPVGLFFRRKRMGAKKTRDGMMRKLSILSISLLILGPQAISSSMAVMINAFPDVPVGTVRLLISLPLITLVMFTLITAAIDRKFNRKWIACSGILIFTIFGTLCAFTDSFAVLVIFRLLMGAGLGMTAAYGVSFISMVYEGEERTKLIGLQSSATNIGSLILMTAAGILASVSWHKAFYIYLIGLPVLLLVIFFVPSFPPDEAGTRTHEKSSLNKKVWLACIGTFAFFILFFVVFSDFAILVYKGGLGEDKQAGMGLTMLSAFALVTSVFYQKIAHILKGLVVPAGVGFTCAGFLTAGLACTLAAADLGAVLIGIGFGIIMPHCYSYAAMNTLPGSAQGKAAAAITFATNIASFCSSYVLNAVLGLIGTNPAENSVFIAIGIIFAAGAVLTLSRYFLCHRSHGML